MAVEGKKQERDSPQAEKKLHQMKQSETAKNHQAKHKNKTNKNNRDEHVQSHIQSHWIPDTNSVGDCRSSCVATGFYSVDCVDDKCMCIKKIWQCLSLRSLRACMVSHLQPSLQLQVWEFLTLVKLPIWGASTSV